MMRLPSRPKPPCFKEILSDIERSTNSDAIFESMQRGAGVEVVVAESKSGSGGSQGEVPAVPGDKGCSLPAGPLPPDSSSSESGGDQQSFHQVLRFLAVMQELQRVPQMLQEDMERLQRLGAEVTTVIHTLKASAGPTLP